MKIARSEDDTEKRSYYPSLISQPPGNTSHVHEPKLKREHLAELSTEAALNRSARMGILGNNFGTTPNIMVTVCIHISR
jgi:hypothetical protein